MSAAIRNDTRVICVQKSIVPKMQNGKKNVYLLLLAFFLVFFAGEDCASAVFCRLLPVNALENSNCNTYVLNQ